MTLQIANREFLDSFARTNEEYHDNEFLEFFFWKTVTLRKTSHTALSYRTDKENREKRIKNLESFYDNFAKYEISPFYGKVNK